MSEQKTKIETLLACLPNAPFKQHLTEEIEHLEAQLAEAQERADRMETALTEIEAWSRAYPGASNMRHVVQCVGDIARAALKTEQEKV